MSRLLATAALAGLILAAALPSAADTRIYVRVGPPRAIVETRVVAPGPRHVWIAGYHRWDGAAYVWVPGAWQSPPRARAHWVEGRWRHERRGWYWVDGRWR